MLTSQQVKLCERLVAAGVVPSAWPEHRLSIVPCAGSWSAMGGDALSFGEVLRPGAAVTREQFTFWLAARPAPAAGVPVHPDAFLANELNRLAKFMGDNGIGQPGERTVDGAIRELAEKHDIDMRTDREKAIDHAAEVLNAGPTAWLPKVTRDACSILFDAGLLKCK